MKPEPHKKTEFEKVKLDDWTYGTIETVERDKERLYEFKGEKKIKDSIRFKFKLDGYEYPHYSRWMYFGYGEKTTLYTKYIVNLVEGAKPDFDFDLRALVGLEVKIMWAEKNEFQFPEIIRPKGEKIRADAEAVITEDDNEEPSEEAWEDGIV
jgi:hypothetical protein